MGLKRKTAESEDGTDAKRRPRTPATSVGDAKTKSPATEKSPAVSSRGTPRRAAAEKANENILKTKSALAIITRSSNRQSHATPVKAVNETPRTAKRMTRTSARAEAIDATPTNPVAQQRTAARSRSSKGVAKENPESGSRRSKSRNTKKANNCDVHRPEEASGKGDTNDDVRRSRSCTPTPGRIDSSIRDAIEESDRNRRSRSVVPKSKLNPDVKLMMENVNKFPMTTTLEERGPRTRSRSVAPEESRNPLDTVSRVEAANKLSTADRGRRSRSSTPARRGTDYRNHKTRGSASVANEESLKVADKKRRSRSAAPRYKNSVDATDANKRSAESNETPQSSRGRARSASPKSRSRKRANTERSSNAFDGDDAGQAETPHSSQRRSRSVAPCSRGERGVTTEAVETPQSSRRSSIAPRSRSRNPVDSKRGSNAVGSNAKLPNRRSRAQSEMCDSSGDNSDFGSRHDLAASKPRRVRSKSVGPSRDALTDDELLMFSRLANGYIDPYSKRTLRMHELYEVHKKSSDIPPEVVSEVKGLCDNPESAEKRIRPHGSFKSNDEVRPYITDGIEILARVIGFQSCNPEIIETLADLVTERFQKMCAEFSVARRRRQESRRTAFSSPLQQVLCLNGIPQVIHLKTFYEKRVILPFTTISRKWSKLLSKSTTNGNDEEENKDGDGLQTILFTAERKRGRQRQF